jgi:hypothetical protein
VVVVVVVVVPSLPPLLLLPCTLYNHEMITIIVSVGTDHVRIVVVVSVCVRCSQHIHFLTSDVRPSTSTVSSIARTHARTHAAR